MPALCISYEHAFTTPPTPPTSQDDLRNHLENLGREEALLPGLGPDKAAVGRVVLWQTRGEYLEDDPKTWIHGSTPVNLSGKDG